MTHPGGTDRTQRCGRSVAAVDKLKEERWGDRFAAPLGSARSGRLRFTNGAYGVVVRADPSLRGLYSASFARRMPAVAVCGGAVNIRYPGPSIDERLDGGSCGHDEVALNTSVTWEIEVRGGASRLLADLVDIRLGALAIGGGVGRVEVALPAPVGTVIVVVHGGASNVAIGRPEGVPARLRVEGGATHLRFDDRLIGIAGKDLDLRSRDYDAASCRYDIAVTGGANNVRIDTERGARKSAATTTTTTR
jgi:hypothetical protein